MQGDIEESAQPVFGSTKSTAQTERFKNFSWKYNLWLILTRSKMQPNSPQLGCREQQIHSFVYPRGGIRWGKVQQQGAEAWPSCWDQHLWSCRGSPGSARSLLPLLGSHRYLKTKASLFFSCIFRKKKKKRNQLASIPHSLVTLKQGTTTTLCILPAMPRNTHQHPVIKRDWLFEVK